MWFIYYIIDEKLLIYCNNKLCIIIYYLYPKLLPHIKHNVKEFAWWPSPIHSVDTSYWTPQARSAQLDYFSYPAGSFHGNLMNTERLAAVGNSELNYNSHSAIGERVYSPSHNNNCNSVPSLPCNYINNYSAGVFRTDVNSNPLLTLRDIPYPLLYQWHYLYKIIRGESNALYSL